MHKTFFLLALMLFLSCKKEPIEYLPIDAKERACYQAVSFLCDGHDSINYFSCKLDDKAFCGSNISGYTVRKEATRNYLTYGPVLDPRDSSAAKGGSLILGYVHPYNPSLFLEVSDTLYADLRTMIERHLKVGQNLPFRQKGVFQSQEKADWTGFTVYIGIPCHENGPPGGSYRFATTNHDQSGSYLRCTRLEKTETPTQTIYHIRMEFACNMQQEGPSKMRWRKLSDGVLDIRIPVDK